MNFNYSQCITEAVRWQRLAFYWADKERDFFYLQRHNINDVYVSNQFKIAAGNAAEWYARAKRAQKYGRG